MKNNMSEFPYVVFFEHQKEEMQIGEVEQSEAYRRAFLENDTGVSNEYCLNVASWD